MKGLQEYVMTEVLQDHKYYFSKANDLLVLFFPKLCKAYVLWNGKTAWYDASCYYDAIYKHLDVHNLNLFDDENEE